MLALLAFGAFAVCILLVLLSGARVYRNLSDSGLEGYEERTARQYIAACIRQAETVMVERFDGCSALVGREEIDGEVYLTRVYCHDGYLRELFSAEDAQLEAEDGEKILPAAGAEFSLEEGIITAWIDGEKLTLYLRGGRRIGQ